jgi:hypothetical protein
VTLSSFIKKLQRLEAEGYGRAKVAVDKPTFWDGNETWHICDLKNASVQSVPIVDGDGYHEVLKNGAHKQRTMIVLGGGWE